MAKEYVDLNFTDDFMFCKILTQHEDICKELIELILGKQIDLVGVPDAENSAIGLAVLLGGALLYVGAIIDMIVRGAIKKLTWNKPIPTFIFMFVTGQIIPLLFVAPYYITHRKNEEIAAFEAEIKEAK